MVSMFMRKPYPCFVYYDPEFVSRKDAKGMAYKEMKTREGLSNIVIGSEYVPRPAWQKKLMELKKKLK